MKKLLMPVLAGVGLCLVQLAAQAQEFKTHVSKEFNFTKGVVAVYNVFGFIKVEGYAGNKVMMEIDETIQAKDNEALEQGKKEFKLGFDEKADSVIAYTSAPYDSRPHKSYNTNGENRHYIVKLEYTLKVPYNVDLRVSTINDGYINVKDVAGTLKVNNVNGPITIANAKGTSDVRTVNGGITANYLAIPPDASSYATINGKLEITYPTNFAANLQFKSMNGEFYTDFPDAEVLPTRAIVTQNKNSNGTQYKLNKDTQIKVGTGGKLFKFETLNGNIYIKKQS